MQSQHAATGTLCPGVGLSSDMTQLQRQNPILNSIDVIYDIFSGFYPILLKFSKNIDAFSDGRGHYILYVKDPTILISIDN